MKTKLFLSSALIAISLCSSTCNSEDSDLYASCKTTFSLTDYWQTPHWMKGLIDSGQIKELQQLQFVNGKVSYIATLDLEAPDPAQATHRLYDCVGNQTEGLSFHLASDQDLIDTYEASAIKNIWEK